MKTVLILAIICVTIVAVTFIMCANYSCSWIFSPDYYENKRLRARIKELEDKLKQQDGFFK